MPNNVKGNWEWPVFDERGMTQWCWRALHPEKLFFKNNLFVGSFTVIDATMGVEIEDDVQIGFGCSILSYSSIDNKRGKVILKKNCRIGSNSVIMPGATIGENSIVGANSFVDRDIPKDEIWVGTPARFLKSATDGQSRVE
jgi:acetyltransferase-like isoleucine patch superfamily enzyme